MAASQGSKTQTPRKAVARPRVKTAAAKVVKQSNPKSRPVSNVNPWSGLLDDGDKVEFGATMELKDKRGRSYWPKAVVTVTKRAGESEEDTVGRASQIVHSILDRHAAVFMDGD